MQSTTFRATLSTAVLGLVLGSAFLAGGTHASAQVAAPTPIVKKHLYPEISSASPDIQNALLEAKRTHKRVILDFGGDWCGDCQVLDIYFHEPANEALLSKYFIKVNVNIGRMDANLDIAKKYGVPIHGVPALAVVDSKGTIIVAQDKEFADMRHMESSSVTQFLTKWKQ